jgi:hypothetical protein
MEGIVYLVFSSKGKELASIFGATSPFDFKFSVEH